MTPTEFLSLETQRIELEKGYYLTPYRVAILAKLSHKIISLLATATSPHLSYAECRYVLGLARTALDMACEEEKEKAPPDGDASDEAKAK